MGDKGTIKDFDSMEMIWKWMWNDVMRITVNYEDEPDVMGAFLTETPMVPTKVREQTMQIWFEKFAVNNYFVALSAILGLYNSGKETGLVIDSGHGVTHAVPTWEGYHLTSSIRRIPLGGKDVTEYLERMLTESDVTLTTTAERMTAGLMKVADEEKGYLGCYVAQNFQEELSNFDKPQDFKMPDDSTVTISDQLIRAPELMFDPAMDGHEMDSMHKLAERAVLACPIDTRKSMFECIIMMGGNTMFEGMKDRLQAEIEGLGVLSEVKVIASPERQVCQYMGGHMLASMAGFKELMVSREKWQDLGATRVLAEEMY